MNGEEYLQDASIAEDATQEEDCLDDKGYYDL